jgi:hypothetical protein
MTQEPGSHRQRKNRRKHRQWRFSDRFKRRERRDYEIAEKNFCACGAARVAPPGATRNKPRSGSKSITPGSNRKRKESLRSHNLSGLCAKNLKPKPHAKPDR